MIMYVIISRFNAEFRKTSNASRERSRQSVGAELYQGIEGRIEMSSENPGRGLHCLRCRPGVHKIDDSS